jgi:cyanate permease
MDRHGTRHVAAVGGIVTCAGLVAFSVATSPVQLVAAWWLLIGPGTAMTYYEPAFVVINQTMETAMRPRALGVVTVIGGFAGAIFLPLIEAMNSSLGWRPTVRLLGLLIGVLGIAAASLTPRRTSGITAGRLADKLAFRIVLADRRFVLITVGLMLTFVASNGLLAHRVDRFTEAGFAIQTVALFAGAASLISLPGRYLGPMFGGRGHGAAVLSWFVLVLVAATALTIPAGPDWFMPTHFVIYGLAFGAILPLRALAMDQWYGTDHYGRRMGIQQTATLVVGGSGALLVGVLRDATGDWLVPMTVLTLAAAAGLVLIVGANRVGRY